MIIHGLSQLSLQGAVNINGQYIQNQTGSLNQVSTYIEYGTTQYEYPHIITFKAKTNIALNALTPVYVDGSEGEYPLLATASAASGSNAANGLVLASAVSGALVDVALAGAMMRINTAPYADGDTLYLGYTGSIITTPLTGSEDTKQTLAVVLVGGSATSGSVAIIPAGGGGGGTGKGFPFTGSGEISGSFFLNGQSLADAGSSSFIITGSSILTGSTVVMGGVEFAVSSSNATGSWRFKNTGSKLALEYYDTMNGVWAQDTLFVGSPLSGSLFNDPFSASYAFTASYVENVMATASYAYTSSYVETASYVTSAETSSYSTTAVSASYAETASYVTNAITASWASSSVSSSYAETAVSASYAETASLAVTASYVNITGSDGIVVNYNGSQIELTSSAASSVYAREIHVSSVSGSDTTGNGTFLSPYATLTKAHAMAASGGGDTIVLHPGTYSETVVITKPNTNIVTLVNGIATITQLSTTAAGGSAKFSNLTIGTFIGATTGKLTLDSCTITNTFATSGAGEYVISECDLENATSAIVLSTLPATFIGGKQNGLVVGHSGSQVNIEDSLSCKEITLSSGSLQIRDSVVLATSTASNAITSVSGSLLSIYNTQILVSGSTTSSKIDIQGSMDYDNIVFFESASNKGYSLRPVTASFQYIEGTASYAANGGGGGNASVTLGGSFPTGSVPSGSLFYNTASNNLYIQTGSTTGSVYEAAMTTVKFAQSAVFISSSAPAAYPTGALWWNNEDGNLYVQVTSPTGSTYVPAVNLGDVNPGGATVTRTFSNVTSSTITHNLNTTTPIIQLYSASKQFIPQDVEILSANSLRLTFNELTTGSAVISTGVTNEFNNLTGGTTVTKTFLTSSAVTFQHNLNTTTPFVQVYDSASNQVIPSYISASNANTVQVGFFQTTTGTIVASTGVTNQNPTAVTASYANTASYLDGSTPTYVMAQNGTGQSIPNNIVTTITGWSTYASNNAGEWNATTGTFTATKAGWYSLSAFLTYTAGQDSTGEEFGVGIMHNSGIIANGRIFTPNDQTGATFKQSTTATGLVRLVPGDTLKAIAFQNSGASRALHTNGNIFTIQELPSIIQR